MKKFTTEIRAIDPNDGELKVWQGPNIEALNWQEAEMYCQNNGLGYCKVVGEFVEEIGWEVALFASKLEQIKNNNN
jgi:hypothetical protein